MAGMTARTMNGRERRKGDGGWSRWAALSAAALGYRVGRAAEAVTRRRRSAAPPAARPVQSADAMPALPRPAGESHALTARSDEGRSGASAGEAAGGERKPFYAPALEAWREFGRDNGMLMSASVSFFIVLSIVPLLLVGVSILGHVLGSSATAREQVMGFFRQFLAGSSGRRMLEEVVKGIIDSRGLVGGVGLGGLVLTALGGFGTLENCINIIWDVPRRSFLWSKIWALGMFVVVGVLFVISFALTTMVSWAQRIPYLGWVAENFGAQATGIIMPAVVSGLMFTLIYKFVPNTRVEWKPALISGAIAGLLFEIFKTGYAVYSSFQDTGATYGALGGVIALVTWIYYSSILLLLGSEFCWVLSGRPGGEQAGAQAAPGAGGKTAPLQR